MSIFKPNYWATGNTAYHKIMNSTWNNVDGSNVYNGFSFDTSGSINDYSGQYNYIIRDMTGNMPNGPVIIPSNPAVASWNDSTCT
mmetsp:Transcript_23838/g.20809  ORF Transcript_23838/g.20809 Transcript_23838/m.20809 type:complete len:85 (+) Transcript_23838:1909-2163(+)